MILKILLYLHISHLFIVGAFIKRDRGENLPVAITLGNLDSLYIEWMASNKSLTACSVITPTMEKIPLEPDSNESRIRYLGTSLGAGYCGVQVTSLLSIDNGTWSLEARTTNNITITKNYTLTILDYLPGPNKTISGTEGNTIQIECGPSEALYCELNSPLDDNKKFYDGPCEYTLYEPLKEKHEGLWKCKYALPEYVQPLFATTQVRIKVPQILDIGYNETAGELNIFCNVVNGKVTSSFCRLTTPAGKSIHVSPGTGTQRYRFYGTTNYHCGVTIQKPLMKEEYGEWLCDLRSGTSGGTHYGGYISINPHSGSETDGSSQLLKARPNYIFVKTGGSVTLNCHANASFEYCWFRDPKGNSFPPNQPALAGSLPFGQCSFYVPSADSSHSGHWTCFAGLEYGSVRELTAKIKVDVADVPFIAEPQAMTGAVGKSATLLCTHPNQLLLKYCRFVRPDGVGFNLNEPRNREDPYVYAGRGLPKGDCGITINSVQDVDFGRWTCTTIPATVTWKDGSGSLSAYIMLNPPEGMSLAWSIGITIGSLIAVGAVAVVATLKFILPRCKKGTDEVLLLNQTIRTPENNEIPRPAFISAPSSGMQARRRSPRRINAPSIY